jgi:hypothetical protein
VRIYTLDHPPPHVHVWKAGAVVKIDLATYAAVEVVGEISDQDISRAERLVARNSERLRRERGFMARTEISAKDRDRFARARARGQARVEDPAAVIDARYDSDADAIELAFKGGGSMSIPRTMVPGLARASASNLDGVRLSPAGDALFWPSLDVDVYVPGLVERAFGTRLFAASTGRRGGRRRSKAKTAAAKANGAKGGRPRKRVTA